MVTCHTHTTRSTETVKIMSASSSRSPGKEVPAEDNVVLNVLLNCEETKSSETKQAHFKSLPTTPLEIKKEIEEDFSIPSCVQTLRYQSMILKDSDQLQHAHFRSGDTFTVDYPIEAECEMAKNVVKWLKELYGLLKSIKEISSSADDKGDHLTSSNFGEIESLIMEGERDEIVVALYETLFIPYDNKKKQMNRFYFHQEGGLDVLMKIYSILVSKKFGDLGIDKEFHMYLQSVCSLTISSYARSFSLKHQVVKLGGLEMSTIAFLRRRLQGEKSILDPLMFSTLFSALCALCSLSELPECLVSLAKSTDIIDQTLAMAPHPNCDLSVPMTMIVNLSQAPEAHSYVARRDVIEKMLEMCEQKEKITNEQSSQSQQEKKEDPMKVNLLKRYTSITLAQIGLGSPHLLFGSIPPHLLQQILNLMSDMLEAASPTEIRLYEEKEGVTWPTFLPYLRYLYKPSSVGNAENSDEGVKSNLYISCCNVLLYGLENPLGRELHLEILVKEGLLDYTMCLPAVLPVECQPRARSLVNELGKHRQLQPPTLCTLAKAHIAKTFCGLQPVMEMNSIGEFLHTIHKGASPN